MNRSWKRIQLAGRCARVLRPDLTVAHSCCVPINSNVGRHQSRSQMPMHCPNAIGTPFLPLRLGRCQFEPGVLDRAADELIDEGEVVGFARAVSDGLSNGYLSMVAVAESHRRQGIATRLVREIMGTHPGLLGFCGRAARARVSFSKHLASVRHPTPWNSIVEGAATSNMAIDADVLSAGFRRLAVCCSFMKRISTFLAGILIAASVPASTLLGIEAYNSGNYRSARAHFEAAAEAGSAEGMHLLGALYYQGHGAPKDLSRAVELFSKAAEMGYAPSLSNLSVMYSVGDGVPKDLQKALDLAVKAAETGDPLAQFNLGQAYRMGSELVGRDYQKAAHWYRKVAEAGMPKAQNEYGLLFAQGHGVPLDYVIAYAWMDMPARAGNPQSQKNKAQLEQILAPRDLERAVKLAREYAARYGPR